MIRHTYILLAGIAILLITALPLPANGLGVSPAHTDVSEIYAGSTVSKSVVVSRENTTFEEIVLADIRGDVASAIKGDSMLVFPRGISQQPYRFTIDTTKLVDGKPYSAQIMFSPKSAVSEAPTTILASINATIRFSVTNKRNEKFRISHAKIEESKERQALTFSYFLVNSGNIQTRPAKIVLAITDLDNQQQIVNETIPSENLPLVAPFSEQAVTIPTTIMLLAGQYTVVASFFDNDATLVLKEQFPLQVTLQDGRAVPLKSTFYRTTAIIIPSLFFVVSIGGLLWALTKRR